MPVVCCIYMMNFYEAMTRKPPFLFIKAWSISFNTYIAEIMEAHIARTSYYSNDY